MKCLLLYLFFLPHFCLEEEFSAQSSPGNAAVIFDQLKLGGLAMFPSEPGRVADTGRPGVRSCFLVPLQWGQVVESRLGVCGTH